MLEWLVASALAGAVALLVPPGSGARRRLADPARRKGPGAWWDHCCRPVPGALGSEARVRIAITAGAVGALVSLAAGAVGLFPTLTGVLALAAYVASGRIIAPTERNRRARRRADLPGALELMASCLRAGLPVRGAAAAVAATHGDPLADDIGIVLAQIAIGDSESRAWLRLAEDESWGLVARDLARSVESGTTLVELLLTHADRARREGHAAVVAAARTVGVRSVLPLMTCYLPAFMLVGIVPIIAGAVPTLLT
ncbi:Type II secretion system (T2SS), protein F [Raineyella antarctica]|uniref:Type II secretion system (T2SS), protein F n=1 Tax=Raineyella antarctica TaxID=1577474 RepID=A0A1G6GHU2_9ACTN|nr:type II secretion system F family protein [Raineyella antarctica]SDB80746.1 Type II secretion system (T2SS), protein F [Raineyella antarctica]